MTYLLHGTTLALAWFVSLNLALSCLVAAAGRAWSARGAHRPAARRWLALRLLPATLSAAFVVGVFVPSYWRFEPRDFTEGFDVTLTALAALGAALVAAGALRGGAAWWRVARRARLWMAAAEPLAIAGLDLPAFRVDAARPMMALVGILRPRLLITGGLIEVLTPDELAAAIAHELGHRDAWDNLKRLAMSAAPDLLGWTTSARVIEREWASAAEQRADHAASTSPPVRIALASALLKVARLTPAAAVVAEPLSTLVGGGAIVARIEELIDPPTAALRPRPPLTARLAAVAVGAAFLYAYPPLLVVVHGLTEAVIRVVP